MAPSDHDALEQQNSIAPDGWAFERPSHRPARSQQPRVQKPSSASPSVPMHSIPGFLPAYARARRMHPELPATAFLRAAHAKHPSLALRPLTAAVVIEWVMRFAKSPGEQ